MTRAYSPRGDRCRTTLLGYPIEIRNSNVAIFDKRNPSVKLATVPSMGAARRFLRGYRSQSTVEATAQPRKERAAASRQKGS